MSPMYIPCAWCQLTPVEKLGDLCPACQKIVDEQKRKYEQQQEALKKQEVK